MSDDVMTVGRRLIELCEAGKNLEAIDELYSPQIVSIESHAEGPMEPRQEGIDAIRGKNQWWLENHDVHGGKARGPFPLGDRFTVLFDFDVTPKVGPMAGKRMQFEEVGLYTVQDGKIVQEEFFYDMG